MNGRVYDPILGRFLSADPYITDPTDSQSFNRYAYVTNNPLSFTDPSGFEGVGADKYRDSHGGTSYPDSHAPEGGRDGRDDSGSTSGGGSTGGGALSGSTGGGISPGAKEAAGFIERAGSGIPTGDLFTPDEVEVISQYIAGYIMQSVNDYRDLVISLCGDDCPPEEKLDIMQTLPGFRNPFQDSEAPEGVKKGARIALIVGIYGMVRGKGLTGRSRAAASQIARGHAFTKHVISKGEFAGFIRTVDQFTDHIENVMNNYTAIRTLKRGRTAYWHEPTRTVVIVDPHNIDGGTAFQPVQGKSYFDGL